MRFLALKITNLIKFGSFGTFSMSTVHYYNPFYVLFHGLQAGSNRRWQNEVKKDTYWPMKWLKLLHHCSGFRNVGEGFLKQHHNTQKSV